MKIANIVTNNKINVSEDFNVVKSMDEIIHGLPTLIISFSYVNKHYPEFDVMEMHIQDNLYWTCTPSEGRDKFREDVFHFVYMVYKDLFEKKLTTKIPWNNIANFTKLSFTKNILKS